MRVICFCANDVNGGTARMFYELACELEKGTDEVVACVDSENDVEIYKKIPKLKRIPVYSESYICQGMYGGSVSERIIKRVKRKLKYGPVRRKNIKEMCRFLKHEKADAVVIHNGGYIGDELANQMLEAANRVQACKKVYILHNCTTDPIVLQVRFFIYDKKVSKYATDIVTVSNFTRQRIHEVSGIKRDILVIPNGLSDVASGVDLRKKAEEIGFRHGRRNVLMIGNFLTNKGQMEFLKAAVKVKEEVSDAFFTIIGNVYAREYYEECMEFAKEAGLREVLGVRTGVNNASEYVGLYDVLAVPSMSNESFGLIGVEAMMGGVPVVAFSCDGIPEVISDGRDGYLVPVGNSEAMAMRIVELLKDKELHDRMSENCRRDYEEKFMARIMADKYRKLLKR